MGTDLYNIYTPLISMIFGIGAKKKATVNATVVSILNMTLLLPSNEV